MSNVKIEYQNFRPSSYLEKYLMFKLSLMADEAPNRAFLHGHFSKTNLILKGFVEIFSHDGKFFATAESKSIKKIMKLIQTQLRKKMKRNKKNHVQHKKITNYLPADENEVAEPARA